MNPGDTLDAEALLRHGAWLAQLARALVASDDEIDDVVQQTWAQALAAPPRHATNLRAWLGAIARNVVRAGRRSDKARAAREELAPRPAPPESPAELVARAELRRAVVDAVLALAEPYRSTLLLRFFEEQEVAAIARITRSPEPTVRTRIRRGIEQVREALQARAVRGEVDAAAAQALLLARLADIAGKGSEGAMAGGTVIATSRALSLMAKWLLAAAVVIATLLVTRLSRTPNPTTAPIDVAQTKRVAPANSSSQVPSDVERRPEPLSPAAGAASSKTDVAPAVPRSGTVRGVVTDALGKPAAGVMVWISRDGTRDDAPRQAKLEMLAAGSRPSWLAPSPVISGSDGRYEITGISTFRDWEVLAFDEVRGSANGRRPLHFTLSHQPIEMPLELVPMVTVKGSVTDVAGDPIERARVHVTVFDPFLPVCSREWIVVSDAAGAWSLDPKAARKFEVTAQAEGFVAYGPPRSFEVDPTQREIAADLVLKSSGGILVKGPIVDENGATINLRARLPRFYSRPNASFESMPFLSLCAISEDETPPPLGSKFIDAPRPVASRIELGGLLAALSFEGQMNRVDIDGSRYRISVPRAFRGTLVLTSEFKVIGTASITDLPASPPLRIDTSVVGPSVPMGIITISLLDAVTGESADSPDAEIELEPATNTGNWRFESTDGGTVPSERSLREFKIPLERMIIHAYRPGFVAVSQEVELQQPDERRQVTLRLARADAGIRGRALLADGRPNVPAMIRVFRKCDTGIEQVRCYESPNVGGFFELTGLAGEEYIVVLLSNSTAPSVSHIRATSPPVEVEVKSVGGMPVRFHFLDSLAPEERDWTSCRITDSEGVYWEENGVGDAKKRGHEFISTQLLPGHYRLLVWSHGCREARAEFDVPAPNLIEIPLERAR